MLSNDLGAKHAELPQFMLSNDLACIAEQVVKQVSSPLAAALPNKLLPINTVPVSLDTVIFTVTAALFTKKVCHHS